jgi:hypothetical protein
LNLKTYETKSNCERKFEEVQYNCKSYGSTDTNNNKGGKEGGGWGMGWGGGEERERFGKTEFKSTISLF